MIHIKNVSVSRNGKDILKNVTWSVNKGEHWSILGLNGSGKTSLLNVVNGYLFPSSGKVKVLGQEFGKTYIPNLRKKIGLVSSSLQQQFTPFDSVLSIVLSGKFASIRLFEAVENEDIKQARHYMEMLNIEHLEDDSYDVLSQGERQRVLIARALMAEPKILILDEPCNGLDIIAREELLQFVDRVANQENGPTVIYVTHYVEEVLPAFTKTLLLKNGEVFAQGETKDLLTESTLSEFFDRPVAVQSEQNRTWVAIKR